MSAKLEGEAEGEEDSGRSHDLNLVGSGGRRRGRGGGLSFALQEEEAAGFSLSLLVSRRGLQLRVAPRGKMAGGG